VQRSLGARAVELSEDVRRREALVPAVMVLLESAIERYERPYAFALCLLLEISKMTSEWPLWAVVGSVGAAGMVVGR
jgi:hypothetical protein